MRAATWTKWAGAALTGLWISAPPGRGIEPSLSPGTIQLELPELGAQRFAPGVLRVLEPEKIRRLVLHIPLAKVFKTYPKINTVAVGPAQRIWARQDEVLCDIDLAVNRGRS